MKRPVFISIRGAKTVPVKDYWCIECDTLETK